MFDELKEVKYFKEVTDSYRVLKCNKEIKCPKSLQKAETHLEPKRASRWKFFVNIFIGSLFLQ